MEYLIIKWLHIMSSTFLFGTGVGSAFYMLFVSLTRDVRATAVVARHVVLADWLFTTPTVFIQPVTGFLMLRIAHFPMSSTWLFWSIILYAVAIGCWLPVVVLQIRLRKISAAAVAAGEAQLPADYWRNLKWWAGLGVPAFFAFVAIFYMMVAKPA
ncbi:DUF2269 domain-containing protein [Oxalobacteraceae bacterium OM1]|nr:DUF2269 domain-containing protein [Oxalobacteraceae bacterium OM1]